MKLHVCSIRRATAWVGAWGLLASAAAPIAAQEGALSQLYAARPPAGSSYVRVVQVQERNLRVRVAGGSEQTVGPGQPATSYAIVAGGQDFPVQVGGKTVGRLQVRPDTFNSVLIRTQGTGYAFTTLDDTSDTGDGLKAELRFYNLAQGCAKGALLLAPAGASVLADVPADTSAARAVNPVRADLQAGCDAARSAPTPLPPMQPGDHLSLFMLGTAAAPVLVVQANRTDPFKR